MPSLQARSGAAGPVGEEPRGVRFAAFQTETMSLPLLATRIRCPSKAAPWGWLIPLPVRVWRTVPLEARKTVTVLSPVLGTQMFVPSKTAYLGPRPAVTVVRMTPLASSLNTLPAAGSTVQTFDPSKTFPQGLVNPVVTVATDHGIEAPGVTIDTDPPPLLAVQNFAPSK